MKATSDVIAVNGILRVKQGKAEEFIKAIKAYMESVKDREGMLLDGIHQSPDDPHVIMVYEQYENADVLVNHVSSKEFTDWVPIRDSFLESREIRKWNIVKMIGSAVENNYLMHRQEAAKP